MTDYPDDEPMRCLSLHQPYAAAVALGFKENETRSWARDYRGLLAIHAAKKWTRVERENARRIGSHLARWAYSQETFLVDSPANQRGAVVALAELAMIRPMTEEMIMGVPNMEMILGDYQVGRYAWVLRNVKPLAEPYPMRGYQSLWTPTDEQRREILERVA